MARQKDNKKDVDNVWKICYYVAIKIRKHCNSKERSMPRKIDPEECILCGSCAEVCPEDAISEGDDSYEIDPEKCTDCGLCEDECPVDAIAEE